MLHVHFTVFAGSIPKPAAHLTPPPDSWYQTHAHVSRLMTFWLWHGLTSNTHLTYSTGQHSFFNFILAHPHFRQASGSILPANPIVILEWVTYLGSHALQLKTIKSYITHLRSLHIDNNLPFEACESPQLQQMVASKGMWGKRAGNRNYLSHLPSSVSWSPSTQCHPALVISTTLLPSVLQSLHSCAVVNSQ